MKKVVLFIILLFWFIMPSNAIEDPFIIYGYVRYYDGSPVNDASVSISIQDLTLTKTTNSEGKYIVILDKYEDGDTITVTAIKDAYTGSAEDILDKTVGGSMINIALQDNLLSIISIWNNVTNNESSLIETYSGNGIEFGIETSGIPTSVNWSIDSELVQSSTLLNWSYYWDTEGKYLVNVTASDDHDTTPVSTWNVNIISDSEYSGIIFFDNVESGTNGWTASGLWHITTRRSDSSKHSWWYGQESTGNYDTGTANSGYLISPPINLAGSVDPVLCFKSWCQTENDHKYKDLTIIQISTDGGKTWTDVDTISETYSIWNLETVDLSDYTGQNIIVRFYFDTLNKQDNSYEGWYIDDIIISG